MTEETRKLHVDVRELRTRCFRVAVIEGPDAGLSCEWDGNEIGIGTAVGNRLILTDGMVSRHHCVIEATPRGLRLRDLESTNGTKLAGFRVESAYLQPGAKFTVGCSSVRLEALEGDMSQPLSPADRFDRVLGRSAAMRKIFADLPRIAAADATVLLASETGTGKGLLAQAIHAASPRAHHPFVVVDCSSIPPTLIESELLGHERGSFTGAHVGRPGAFELASRGTVFLDEIGELPLEVQPKLLRALEERVIRRVGGSTAIKLDLRVIAATNRDLRRAVNEGTFRADLLYRLNTFTIRIPPLRDRKEDIPQLVAHFYEQFAAPGTEAPPGFVESLMRRDWPGNVRELRNAVERKILVGDPDVWGDAAPDRQSLFPPRPEDVPLSFRAAKELAMARWEGAFVRDLFARNGGNVSRAARAAAMDRTHLRELLRRHGVIADGQ